MSTIHVIVTCGTSGLNNRFQREGKAPTLTKQSDGTYTGSQNFRYPNGLVPDDREVTIHRDEPSCWSDLENYGFSGKNPGAGDVLKSAVAEMEESRPSAEKWGPEVSAIESVLEKEGFPEGRVRIYLVLTDTPLGKLGYALIASYLRRYHPNYSLADPIAPRDFSNFSNPNFVGRGIPSLLREIAALFQSEVKSDDRAIFIGVGGYKITVNYLEFLALMFACPAYFVADRRKVKELDKAVLRVYAPLAVDHALLRYNRVLLENLRDQPWTQVRSYYAALDPSLQSLLFEAEGDTLQLNALGKHVLRSYDKQRQSLFRATSRDNPLIRLLGDNADTFLSLADIGETIWIGDKAGEMADHAQHHHLNLFGYAQLVLLPLLREGSPTLKREELFLLLCMIFLHDCGHAWGFLRSGSRRIPLLATEIRTFHNLLGYLRMKDSGFQNRLKEEGVHLDAVTLEAIGRLSIYHRKKMPLLSGGFKVTGHDYSFGPLQNESLTVGGERIEGNRLCLIAALFRIIDGMDKQIGRAGDAHEVVMKAEALYNDLPSHWDRIQRMEEALTEKETALISSVLAKVFESYASKESLQPGKDDDTRSKGLVSPQKFEEQPVFERLKEEWMKAFPQDASRLGVAWELLDARARLMFNVEQPRHYYSDLLLGMPKVTVQRPDGKTHYAVRYPPLEDRALADSIADIWKRTVAWVTTNIPKGRIEQSTIKSTSLPTPQTVLKGIEDEYCSSKNNEVEKILREHGITFEFSLAQ